jgi:sugar O-acyltransferase (sialic acid O-acetyltransferase NeuD family)
VPFEELARTYSADRFKLLVAIGYRRVNRLRAEKCREARSAGYQLVSYISTRASVADNVPIGDNCIILEHNHVQPYARLGSNVVMLSGNLVSHHTSVGDDCFLAGGCAIGGRVTLGRGCFVGLNATVRNLIAVGDHCVVGAGAVLLESSAPAAVYRAEPARRLDITSDTMDDL